MFQVKRILVPVDGSELSKAALPIVISVAKKYGASVLLVHVADTAGIEASLDPGAGGFVTYSPGLIEESVEAVRKAGKDVLSDLTKGLRAKKIRVRSRLLDGKAPELITETAVKERADLIVIASRGRTGLTRTFLGSLTDHLIRESGIPVLVTTADNDDNQAGTQS